LNVFETLIESRTQEKSLWRSRAVAWALAAHAAVLSFIVLRHFFTIPPITEPPVQVTFARFAAPPPPPPAPAAPRPERQTRATPKPHPVVPKELVAPEKVPERVAPGPAPAPIVEAGAPAAVRTGAPGGVQGGAPGGTLDEPLRIGGDVTPGVAIERPDPEYPLAARAAHVEGIVILEAVIRRDGTVGDIKILRGLPMGLSEAAVAAVRRWRYKPGAQKGAPVDVYMTVTVKFTLARH
jgi:protein TonB